MNTSSRQIFIAILLGIISTFFLSVGFIVNSVTAFRGNNWAWTASLRYLMLMPLLAVIVLLNGKLSASLKAFRAAAGTFLIWGNLGFGIFYGLLVYACQLAPGWLVSASFQTTIIAGLLLESFLYKKRRSDIPRKIYLLAFLLSAGVFIMQGEKFSNMQNSGAAWLSIFIAIIAAFLWPLGSRELMRSLEKKQINLDPTQRVLGMTLGSLPVLLILAVYGYSRSGLPPALQVETSLAAVVFSGVFGTVMFYKAMQIVKHNVIARATVEATQVSGILFTLMGEVIFRGMSWPGFYGQLGFGVILVAFSLYVILCFNLNTLKQHKERLA